MKQIKQRNTSNVLRSHKFKTYLINHGRVNTFVEYRDAFTDFCTFNKLLDHYHKQDGKMFGNKSEPYNENEDDVIYSVPNYFDLSHKEKQIYRNDLHNTPKEDWRIKYNKLKALRLRIKNAK